MWFHECTIGGIFYYSLMTRVVDTNFLRFSHLTFFFSSFYCQRSVSTSLLNFSFILYCNLEPRSLCEIFLFFFEVFPFILPFQLPLYPLSWFWVILPMCQAFNTFSPYFTTNTFFIATCFCSCSSFFIFSSLLNIIILDHFPSHALFLKSYKLESHTIH